MGIVHEEKPKYEPVQIEYKKIYTEDAKRRMRNLERIQGGFNFGVLPHEEKTTSEAFEELHQAINKLKEAILQLPIFKFLR